jgi:hypothetical protein
MKKEYIKPDVAEQVLFVRFSILTGSLKDLEQTDDPFTGAPVRKPF